MSRLEVQESPVEVTKREKLHFRFKLDNLLEDGVTITGAEIRLVEELSAEEISAVVTNVSINGAEVRALVDWTNDDIKADSNYLLFCKATLSAGETEEVFCRFLVFGI